MTTPQALHHSLLRPCVLHILRAAGYHSTRPSVLDTLTDLAARYMFVLAQTTVKNAVVKQGEPELALEISIQDVRMAMEECGALLPGLVEEDQDFFGEDTSGVEDFVLWATGPKNREIRRVALEGDSKEDYLTALKKKHSTTDEDSRYTGTILGKPTPPRKIKVEGSDISSLKEWAEKLSKPSQTPEAASSRRESSDLSTLGEEPMEF